MTKKTVNRSVGAVLAGAGLAGGLALISPTDAHAYATNCSRTSCTIYFSKSETRAIADGRLPRIAGSIATAATTVLRIYQFGARIAASRGQCTAFTVTLVPWQTNGYYPYNCNWN